MPEAQRELVLTRTTFLELQEEQRLAKEGFELLDEKRILLAAEILRRIARVRALTAQLADAEKGARGALRAALARHGLDELAAYPPLSMRDDRIETRRSRLLGLELIDARSLAAAPLQSEAAVDPSPEARACALAYRAWLAPMVELAACSMSLRRLAREYLRTERRTRAIEKVLLPELGSLLALIEEQLESLNQEEIARLREAVAASGTPGRGAAGGSRDAGRRAAHKPAGGGFTSSNR
jgi:V/A-type H+/Na+-transporting ATPase subunit D